MIEDSTTISDAMLEVFRSYGAEYIFSSPGSEWAPVWDALAKAKAAGAGPVYINTRHEALAVCLAMGYYYQTRKLPILLLHAGVGLLHAAMELRAAARERVPMVVLSGTSAGYGEMSGPDPGTQWIRALDDVGGADGLIRPVVKRAHQATSREVLLGMIQDACRQALTQPTGPVFLSVPLEFLFGECPSFCRRGAPAPAATHADPAVLEEIARDLRDAKRPVLVTEYAGRDPGNVSALVELAENLALPVVEATAPNFMNFPRDHYLHQGFDADELLSQADLVLLVGEQTPWYPPSKRPCDAKVILIDDSPSQNQSPYWAMGVDAVVGGELGNSLRELNALVSRLKDGAGQSEGVYQERRARCKEGHEKNVAAWRSRALAAAGKLPMNGLWATRLIGEVLPGEAMVLEETITHKASIQRNVPRNLPGTYYRCGGGLGTGLGIALGHKFAQPNRPVVALMGDGSFNYNPVPAAFGFAQQMGSPILVILMNNGSYAAMKRSHLAYYPDGWSARTDTFFGTEIDPRPNYVQLAQAFGGYGEKVEDPEALRGALERALERTQAGQLALLDLILDPHI